MHACVRPSVAAVAILSLTMVGACSLFEPKSGDEQVRDLATRVEGVQQQAELAQQLTAAALQSLQKLTARDFGGDALGAYDALKRAVADSVKQETALRGSLEPMQKAAERLFAAWGTDLEGFGNAELHQRSQERLKSTRERYQSVVQVTQASLTTYSEINRNLQDHVRFFGRDLNQEALSSVRNEVRDLTQRTAALQEQLVECRTTAGAYAESIALPSVPLTVPAAPAGETSRSK
ncbi:MAG: DUF2959 family protein [Planctomycetota bacterium]